MRAVSEVTALDSQLNSQIEGANTAVLACTAMVAADVTAWSGFYAGWVALHEHWTFVQTTLLGSYNPIVASTALVYTDGIYETMKGYQQQFETWQPRIHQACPSYVAPPAIADAIPHDTSQDWTTKVEDAAKIVAGATLSLAIGLAVLKVVQILGDVRQIAKA